MKFFALFFMLSFSYAAFCLPSQAPRLWKIEVQVNGDTNCDKESKPEAFTFYLDQNSEKLDFIYSISISSPAALTKSPFLPTSDELQFLQKVSSDFNFLKAHQEQYQKLSEELFRKAFGSDFPVASSLQILENLGIMSQQFYHSFRVDKLVEFQKWYFKKLTPVLSMNSEISVAKDAATQKLTLPLLIFGEVRQEGSAPQYNVKYNPAQTSISSGAQNEANDTTLCQLRTGIFNTQTHPTADIVISKVLRVSPEPSRRSPL